MTTTKTAPKKTVSKTKAGPKKAVKPTNGKLPVEAKIPSVYVAFRWHDNSGKEVRYWREDAFSDAFNICPIAEFNVIRNVCEKIQMPVMFLGPDDGRVEDGIRLLAGEEIPR